MASGSSQNRGSRFLSSIKSSLSNIGSSNHKSVNCNEGVDTTNPKGGTIEDATTTTIDNKKRWKQGEQDSLWGIIRKSIGADVTSLGSLPIFVYEPMSALQKMAERMEYTHLLDLADECEDPHMRLVFTASWAVSTICAWQRIWNPFNPILGETYEMDNEGKFTLIAEEVSHHPPIVALHAENEHFTCDITYKMKTKLLGNSVDSFPTARQRVTLKREGVELDLVIPPSKVNNILIGRSWISSSGDMIMTNMTTGDKVVLKFQPTGWFRAPCYEVNGYVYNADNEPKLLMTGKWNKSISYQPCDITGKPLLGTELKEVWRVIDDVPKDDKFQYKYFSHKVNSFKTAPRKLLASDSRLRPDRYALEKGDQSKAASEKRRLEERQRSENRKREAKGDNFTTRWFDRTGEVAKTPWGEVDIYQFNGKYNEHRAVVDSTDNIDDVHGDVEITEFNPWQYDN